MQHHRDSFVRLLYICIYLTATLLLFFWFENDLGTTTHNELRDAGSYSGVRDLAYGVFARAELVNVKQAPKHLGGLSKAAKKKFLEIRSQVLEEIANQDWKTDYDDFWLAILVKDIVL